MSIEQVIQLTQRPRLYRAGTHQLWTDEHIARQMLQVHLDPDDDGASRRHRVIDSTVDWLEATVLSSGPARVLDLGCGPGLYSQRLAVRGHDVTGIDISENSIEYARRAAQEAQLPIEYRLGDYTSLDLGSGYDVAILIYCDFCALTDRGRGQLLLNVHSALKPRGRFVFDVSTEALVKRKSVGRSWYHEPGGFWAPEPYLALEETHHYAEDRVLLDQAVILTQSNEVRSYHIWHRYFSEPEITQLLGGHGFSRLEFEHDLLPEDSEEFGNVMFCLARRD